jgi:hypothetical protein
VANYQYSADLIDDILFRAGEPTDGTSDYDDAALRYLNRAYQAICSGGNEIDPTIDEVWWWLRSTMPETITLQPPRTTGTVNLINNSTSGSFSSAPSTSVEGQFLKVTDEQDLFRISDHTAGETVFTLDSVFTGTTNTAAEYNLIQLEYDLSASVHELLQPLRVYRNSQFKIPIVDLAALEDKYPLSQITSDIPRLAAMIGERKIRFSHYPSEIIRLDADYLQKATLLTNSDSEEPLVPHEYRRLLADVALMFLYSDKQDNRAGDAINLARSGLAAMSREHKRRTARQAAPNYARILTRQDQISRRKGPLRTTSGMIIG